MTLALKRGLLRRNRNFKLSLCCRLVKNWRRRRRIKKKLVKTSRNKDHAVVLEFQVVDYYILQEEEGRRLWLSAVWLGKNLYTNVNTMKKSKFGWKNFILTWKFFWIFFVVALDLCQTLDLGYNVIEQTGKFCPGRGKKNDPCFYFYSTMI